MIPVALVTGFLGSGKTTFLQRTIERNRDRKLVYVVNEFSGADVDGRRLGGERADVVSIPGGSIFCACLVTEFIGQLRSIAGRGGVDGVVIEASGIADPKVVGRMLAETGLDREYRLGAIVSVVDPGTFGTLMHTLPNIAAQVEASTVAIVNKADLYAEQEIVEVEKALRGINRYLKIMRAEFCWADVDLFADGGEGELRGEYARCVDPSYASATVTLPGEVDVARLVDAIQAMRDDVYRVKGFVRTGGKLAYVDVCSVPGREPVINISEADVDEAVSARPAGLDLAVIVRGQARSRLETLVSALESVGDRD